MSWCLKGLAGMDQLFLPIKNSEKEKARAKRVKTHRLSTKSHYSSCMDCRKKWAPGCLQPTR